MSRQMSYIQLSQQDTRFVALQLPMVVIDHPPEVRDGDRQRGQTG